MKQQYENLSELLQSSSPAEAFWAQLPEWVQQRAVDRQNQIHSAQELRAFARSCQREEMQ